MTVVLDSAVAFVMPRVDFVLLGAALVVENGGIINSIGTYQVAIVAKAMKRPVYVAAESYKFARLFPLHQRDYPVSNLAWPDEQVPADVVLETPSTDFTPPMYIDLIFTDLGIITPAAASDELIKLYQGE